MSNTTLPTPAQLSSQAILNIESCPASHNQLLWHSHKDNTTNLFIHPCGTSHCYAGHVDLLLGIPCDCQKNKLYNNVRAALGLNVQQWRRITAGNNTIARIKALHKMYFVDGIYGQDGYDEDDYDEGGYDRAGFDVYGYDRGGYKRGEYV